MSHLHRHLAPISAEAWEQIEEEAKQTLKATLAARKLVDFDGPKGWGKSAVSTGRVKPAEPAPRAGVTAAVRKILPLTELRAVFELSREELDAVDRGSDNPDLDPVTAASIERIWSYWRRKPDNVVVPGHDLPMTQHEGQTRYLMSRKAAIEACFGDSLDEPTLIDLTEAGQP